MATRDPSAITVRSVPVADVRPLRAAVLRAGRPESESVFPGDDLPATVHFAALVDGRVAGVASLYAEARPQSGSAWRLRGMATAPEARGRGMGAALVEAAIGHVATHGGGELWCNARELAIGFYERMGFAVVSEPFEIAGIGSHVVMSRDIAGGGGLSVEGHR